MMKNNAYDFLDFAIKFDDYLIIYEKYQRK